MISTPTAVGSFVVTGLVADGMGARVSGSSLRVAKTSCPATIEPIERSSRRDTGPMTTAAHEHHHDEDVPQAVHAMVLFGDTTLYLSHMPLFSPPHNDQVLLEVSLSKAGRTPKLATARTASLRGRRSIR